MVDCQLVGLQCYGIGRENGSGLFDLHVEGCTEEEKKGLDGAPQWRSLFNWLQIPDIKAIAPHIATTTRGMQRTVDEEAAEGFWDGEGDVEAPEEEGIDEEADAESNRDVALGRGNEEEVVGTAPQIL